MNKFIIFDLKNYKTYIFRKWKQKEIDLAIYIPEKELIEPFI